MNNFKPDLQKLQTIQTLIEASLNCQRQREVLQLLDIVNHYDDYTLYLQYILINTTNELYSSVTLLLLKQSIENGSSVDFVELTKTILTLISNGKQHAMKCGCSLLTKCFLVNPLTTQMILQFIGTSLQTNQPFLIQFAIELLEIVMTDHFEQINDSYYPTIQKIMELELHLFSTVSLNLKSKIIATFTELILFEASFLTNAFALLLNTFCSAVFDDAEYRIKLCSFLVSISQLYIESIDQYMSQLQSVIQILLTDKRESVFVEAIEVVISFSSEFPEATLPFLLNFTPLFFERCVLTNELIYKINEDDQIRQKEQVVLRQDEQYDYDISVRSSIFNLFEIINGSFDSNVVGNYIISWFNCFEQRQKNQSDWRNIEVMIKFLNVSVSYYHNPDLIQKFGKICSIPIENITNENTFIQRIAIEFIGNNPLLIIGSSQQILDSLFNFLLKLIGSSNYTFSCISIQALTKLINGGLFVDKLKLLFNALLPTIKNSKGQPLLNICDLLSSIVESLGIEITDEMATSIQNELINCICINSKNEDVVDICLTTIYSNIMIFNSVPNEMVNSIIAITFQCIGSFVDSADIVSSCLRVFGCLYKKNIQYMSMFIKSHPNEILKLFELTLPQLHALVIQDSYGLLGDILNGCSDFVVEHIDFFMKNIIEMISTFRDESITPLIWFMIQSIIHIPQCIIPFIPLFAKKSFDLLTINNDSVLKNMFAFISKTIPIDSSLYLPHLQLLTGPLFKSVLQIKQSNFIIEILLNFGKLIIANPMQCKQNYQTIKDVYVKAAQMIPPLFEITQNVITILETTN